MIAHNPLHGSGRAVLPHPALALGNDAHATQGIGMTDDRQRQPTSDEAAHAIPKDAAILAAPRQRAVPKPPHLESKNPQRLSVHGHSVVPDVSTHHRFEPLAQFGDGFVPASLQFGFHLVQLRLQPFAHRLPQHREPSVAPLLHADVRKAKKVERLRFPFSTPLPLVDRIRTELQKSRLLGMQFQVELPHSFGEFRPKLIGIRFAVESNHDVVRESHDDDIAVRPLPTPRLGPQVKYVMKIDVRQKRRGTSALGRPFLHAYPFPILQHAGSQPFLDQPHDAPICNPMLDELHQPFVGNPIEKALDVQIEHPVHFLRQQSRVQRIQRLMLAAPRPEPVRKAEKIRFVDGIQHLDRRALDDFVFQRRDSERSLPPVGLRDKHPTHRLRSVRSALQPIGKSLEIFFQLLAVVPPRLPVHARCGFLLQAEVSPAQCVQVVDVVQERREPQLLILSCCLTYPLQRTRRVVPARCPGRVLLWQVPFGQTSSLHSLRCRWPGVVWELLRCRVGGGARLGAGLRPPLKLHVQFSRMQLSRRSEFRPGTQRRNQRNQTDQPQLTTKTPSWVLLPPRTAPTSMMMRPQASHHPTIKLVEESPHVGTFVILAPPTNHRIELAGQLHGVKRDAAARLPANRVSKPVDRLLCRIRIQIPAPRAGDDLRGRQVHRTTAALDLVSQERKALTHMHDPRLLQIEPHAQGGQDLFCASQCRFRFAPTSARHRPVVGVPRQLISMPAHLPIEWREENVAQQGRNHPTLRGALRCGKQVSLFHVAGRQHLLNQRQHSTIGHTLGYQGHKFFMINGPEVVLQVRIHDPLSARFDLAPNLAQRILGRPTRSVAKAAVVKKWFEDRLQPIAQRLLTYPVDDRGDAKRAPFTRFTGLRDVHPSDRLGLVAVGAQLLLQSLQVVIQSLLERFETLPIDAATATVRLDFFPCRSQVLRLIHLVHQRVHLLLPVRIEPVDQSPRRATEGFFRSGTVPCRLLTHWLPPSFPTPSQTAFPGVLIRPREGHAVYRLRASGTSPSSDFSPNPGHPFTSSAYGRAFARRSLHAEHPMRSPRVTTCSSTPCRPHTPWFEGWMDNAFVAVMPTRPYPLFGRPVHRRDGSHRFRPGASPQALRIPPRGGHPALLDFPRGQRGITPAFGYGAPHPSTSGTSTHLNTSLPSAHYRSVRLPKSVRHRRTSLDFPTRPKATAAWGGLGTSRFPREVSAYVHGVSDRAGLGHTSRYRCTRWGLPLLLTASASRSEFLTRLHTRPARSPVNASTPPLR